MTINEQIKTLDNKIRSNQAHYYLDRQNAKISALSSGELDKYEYLTGEDLGYKPDVFQKAMFEYSPLGKVFNKRLKTDGKNERLLKRLKNIADKTDNQLDLIKGLENKQIDLIRDQKTKQSDPAGKIKFTDEKLNKLIDRIFGETEEYTKKDLEYAVSKNSKYNINLYKGLENFAKNKTNGKFLIKKAKKEEDKPWRLIFKMKKKNVKKISW